MSRILPIFLFFSVLSGCSINTPIQTLDPSLISDDSFGEYEIYADLIKQSGKWTFTNINDSSGEILLNNMTLDTLAHTGYKRCHRGIFGLTSGNCKEIDSPWLNYEFMGRNLILFPISWALAPVGIPIFWSQGDFSDSDVFFFPVQVLPTFDNDKLKHALFEASQSHESDDIIKEIGDLYIKVKDQGFNVSYEYPPTNAEELSKLTNEFRHNLNEAVKSYLKDNLTLVLKDKSGLLNKKAPNPNYLAKAKITIDELAQTFQHPDIEPLSDIKSVFDPILPADSLEQLQTRLLLAQTKISNLIQSNNKIYQSNLRLIERTNKINEKTFAQFKKKSLNNKFIIDWEISPSSVFLLKDMDYDIELPPRLVLSQSELDIEPYVKLTINSMNFTPMLPVNNILEDFYLRASTVKNHVELTNKTDRSIELKALKIELNDSQVENELSQALEPGETYKYFLSKADLRTLSPLFSGLTKEKANKTNVLTKIAIDYIEGGSKRTLTGESNNRLSSILQN